MRWFLMSNYMLLKQQKSRVRLKGILSAAGVSVMRGISHFVFFTYVDFFYIFPCFPPNGECVNRGQMLVFCMYVLTI